MIYNPSKYNFLPKPKKETKEEKEARTAAKLDAITITPPPHCYYCDRKSFKNRYEYQKHVLNSHSGKLCYPSVADLKLLSIEAQSMLWEI